MKNRIIPYKAELKDRARELRKESTLAEVILWNAVKNKAAGVEFHRQVPLDHFIVDFYCHELMLAIEIDGSIHSIEEVKGRDDDRQRKLEGMGVNFIRFENDSIKKDLAGVLKQLAEKITGLKEEIEIENKTSP